MNSIDDLFRKDGKLNTAILYRDWFLQSNLNKSIKEQTNFLPENSSITERIYCIKNNIKNSLLCPICKQKKYFILFIRIN